jgi:hypothetical protein
LFGCSEAFTIHHAHARNLDFASVGVPTDGILIVSGGEIDIRCMVHKQVVEKGRDASEVIHDLADKYMSILKRNSVTHKYIGATSIMPAMRFDSEKNNPEYPFRGEDDDRRDWTLLFNDLLRQRTAQEGLLFLDIFSYYADSEGFLDPAKSDGNVHANPNDLGYVDRQVDLLVSRIDDNDHHRTLSLFQGNHYDSWIDSRMKGVMKYVGPDFFESKTLLELGCGHAHNGKRFLDLGAKVTSSDSRIEHIEFVNKLYPRINTVLFDCDRDRISSRYDVILHWGVLYHIREVESHLDDVMQHCNVLLLETEVFDSDDPTLLVHTDEDGYDQAFNRVGSRPTPGFIESIFHKNGFDFKAIHDPILNTIYHNYDGPIGNTNTWVRGFRRFWICWKSESSPLLLD